MKFVKGEAYSIGGQSLIFDKEEDGYLLFHEDKRSFGSVKKGDTILFSDGSTHTVDAVGSEVFILSDGVLGNYRYFNISNGKQHNGWTDIYAVKVL